MQLIGSPEDVNLSNNGHKKENEEIWATGSL
jgi:hypothetical protein